MLQIKSIVVNKTGSETDGDYTYIVNTSIHDNVVNTISCQIEKKVAATDIPEGSEPIYHQIQVGFIQYQNGQRTTQINEDEDEILHLTKFKSYLAEFKSEVEKPVKK